LHRPASGESSFTTANNLTQGTAYPKNNNTLEAAQHIANNQSPLATKLYDRRQDEISLDEVGRILI
jgi:hypothetical protein